jgi:hypothetical protein
VRERTDEDGSRRAQTPAHNSRRGALPKDLGSDEMRIEIRARNGTEFKDSLRALADSADGVERILDSLCGQNLKQGF